MLAAAFKNRIRSLGWQFARAEDWAPQRRWHSTEDDPGQWRRLLGDNDFSADVRKELADDDPYRREQFLYELTTPVTVEPLHGMVIQGNRILAFLNAIHRGVAPPLPWRLSTALAQRRAVHVSRAVLLRHHYGELNYFHFYNDVLSKLVLLSQWPEYEDWPWLISQAQHETAYFQGFLKRSPVQPREIIIQRDRPVRVEKLVALKGMGLTPAWVDGLRAFLRVPSAAGARNDLLFLRRGGSTRRPLRNQAEVESICGSLGFRAVDPGQLDLEAQIELFRNARVVVAEHGSGSTNILFRRGAPLTLLELFPPDHISTCYFLMAGLLGHEYRFLRGEAQAADGYVISPEGLRRALADMLPGA